MMYTWTDGTYLAHHGIKGQRWGVRRFQNPDGSLTEAGRRRYGDTFEKAANKAREFKKLSDQERKKFESQLAKRKSSSVVSNADNEWKKVAAKYPAIKKEVGDWRNVDDDELWDVLESEHNADLSGLKKAIKTSNRDKGVTEVDLQRWINVTKHQQQYYDNLIKKYENIPYGSLNNRFVYDAKSFVNHAVYENADYTDVYYNGKVDNYQFWSLD